MADPVQESEQQLTPSLWPFPPLQIGVTTLAHVVRICSWSLSVPEISGSWLPCVFLPLPPPCCLVLAELSNLLPSSVVFQGKEKESKWKRIIID